MGRLELLDASITKIKDALGQVEDEDRFNEILGDDTFIPFFEEFRDTSYYFVSSFESFMNYFIEEFRAYGALLQRRIYLMYGLMAFCIAFLGMLVSLLISRDFIQKIRKFEAAFTRAFQGDFSVRLDIESKDEFGSLSKVFNDLTIDLKENVETILKLTKAIGSSISRDTSLEDLLNVFVHSIVQDTSADTAFIYLTEKLLDNRQIGNTNALIPTAGEAGVLSDEEKEFLNTCIQKVYITQETLLYKQHEGNAHLPESLSSLMIVPLLVESELLGVLAVAIHAPEKPFTDLGITRLSTFADFSALTLDNHVKYADVIEKGEAEYQALQAQVQPHFIYNVLNGFIGLNRMGETKDLENSIIALKDMLRYTQDSRTWTTLQDELGFVETYCRLQKLRFDERLQYSISYDPFIADFPLPRLLLQPLVENAIIHGIEPIEFNEYKNSGQLFIEAFQILQEGDKGISIVIKDNGVGFDIDQLSERENIGIGNVRKRLSYAFPRSQFSLRSRLHEGTEIRITLHENRHS